MVNMCVWVVSKSMPISISVASNVSFDLLTTYVCSQKLKFQQQAIVNIHKKYFHPIFATFSLVEN